MSFQPICGLCLSDCDRRGSVTSCSHFLCSRCLSRLPTAAPCPLCRRPCRMMMLDQAEVQPLLQGGAAVLEQASRVVSTQLRHYQETNKRMRQALAMLHGQCATLRRQREEAVTESAAVAQKARALEGECQRLREQLTYRVPAATTDVGDGGRGSSAHGRHVSRSPSAASSSSPRSHGHRHHQSRTAPAAGAAAPPLPPPQQPPQQGHSQRSFGRTPPPSSRSPASINAIRSNMVNLDYANDPRHHSGHSSFDASLREAAAARPPSAGTAAAPLGWSASSFIAKRSQLEGSRSCTPSMPSLQAATSTSALTTSCATPCEGDAAALRPFSAGAAPNDLFTPRSQAIASLTSPLPPPSRESAGRQRDGAGVTGSPGTNFRLDTPLAAALLQRHALVTPTPVHRREVESSGIGAAPVSAKPLQRLFAMRGAPP